MTTEAAATRFHSLLATRNSLLDCFTPRPGKGRGGAFPAQPAGRETSSGPYAGRAAEDGSRDRNSCGCSPAARLCCVMRHRREAVPQGVAEPRGLAAKCDPASAVLQAAAQPPPAATHPHAAQDLHCEKYPAENPSDPRGRRTAPFAPPVVGTAHHTAEHAGWASAHHAEKDVSPAGHNPANLHRFPSPSARVDARRPALPRAHASAFHPLRSSPFALLLYCPLRLRGDRNEDPDRR